MFGDLVKRFVEAELMPQYCDELKSEAAGFFPFDFAGAGAVFDWMSWLEICSNRSGNEVNSVSLFEK